MCLPTTWFLPLLFRLASRLSLVSSVWLWREDPSPGHQQPLPELCSLPKLCSCIDGQVLVCLPLAAQRRQGGWVHQLSAHWWLPALGIWHSLYHYPELWTWARIPRKPDKYISSKILLLMQKKRKKKWERTQDAHCSCLFPTKRRSKYSPDIPEMAALSFGDPRGGASREIHDDLRARVRVWTQGPLVYHPSHPRDPRWAPAGHQSLPPFPQRGPVAALQDQGGGGALL